jgi:hypothetical protein
MSNSLFIRYPFFNSDTIVNKRTRLSIQLPIPHPRRVQSFTLVLKTSLSILIPLALPPAYRPPHSGPRRSKQSVANTTSVATIPAISPVANHVKTKNPPVDHATSPSPAGFASSTLCTSTVIIAPAPINVFSDTILPRNPTRGQSSGEPLFSRGVVTIVSRYASAVTPVAAMATASQINGPLVLRTAKEQEERKVLSGGRPASDARRLGRENV